MVEPLLLMTEHCLSTDIISPYREDLTFRNLEIRGTICHKSSGRWLARLGDGTHIQ